ncbi:MAG TPA: hypothetical protein PLV68_00260, partial [Ilumatobacteraceae bacterium]|nr:hypothetical protein [Ilumatobacteraceae bacterium]
GHVNNTVYWAIAEEVLAGIGTWREPASVALEHHGAIDAGAAVAVTVAPGPAGADVWVHAGDALAGAKHLAAVIRIRRGPGATAQ